MLETAGTRRQLQDHRDVLGGCDTENSRNDRLLHNKGRCSFRHSSRFSSSLWSSLDLVRRAWLVLVGDLGCLPGDLSGRGLQIAQRTKGLGGPSRRRSLRRIISCAGIPGLDVGTSWSQSASCVAQYTFRRFRPPFQALSRSALHSFRLSGHVLCPGFHFPKRSADAFRRHSQDRDYGESTTFGALPFRFRGIIEFRSGFLSTAEQSLVCGHSAPAAQLSPSNSTPQALLLRKFAGSKETSHERSTRCWTPCTLGLRARRFNFGVAIPRPAKAQPVRVGSHRGRCSFEFPAPNRAAIQPCIAIRRLNTTQITSNVTRGTTDR